jgi:glycosyltransferase involved in cell wall biosynthesis
VSLFISIVIPTTCNREKSLARAVESVKRQTYKNYELLIIEARSRSSSSESKISKEGLQVIPTLRDLNASEARNKGGFLSKGEWIAFLDDDDQWHSSYLYEIEKTVKSNTLDFVLGTLIEEREDRKTHKLTRKFLPEELYFLNPGITGSNIVIRKESFMQVNGFSNELSVSQDKAIVIELIKKKYKYLIAENAYAIHCNDEAHRLTSPKSQLRGYIEFLDLYINEMPDVSKGILIKKILVYFKNNFSNIVFSRRPKILYWSIIFVKIATIYFVAKPYSEKRKCILKNKRKNLDSRQKYNRTK